MDVKECDFRPSDTHLQMLKHLFLETRFTLISCRFWQYPERWNLPFRSCPDSFFFFPLRGSVRVALKGTSFPLRPGQFLMLPENTYHGLTSEKNCRRIELVALHCHIHDRWGRPLLARLSSPVGQSPASASSLRSLQEIAALLENHSLAGQERGQSFLMELLAAQLAEGVRMRLPPHAKDPRVGIVLQNMEENFSSSSLSIEDLAAEVKISAVQLRKLFRRETGKNPKEFLNTLRLREAGRRLRQTSESIKEIARACGFSQDHYFHRVFRSAFACTPSEYRRDEDQAI